MHRRWLGGAKAFQAEGTACAKRKAAQRVVGRQRRTAAGVVGHRASIQGGLSSSWGSGLYPEAWKHWVRESRLLSLQLLTCPSAHCRDDPTRGTRDRPLCPVPEAGVVEQGSCTPVPISPLCTGGDPPRSWVSLHAGDTGHHTWSPKTSLLAGRAGPLWVSGGPSDNQA